MPDSLDQPRDSRLPPATADSKLAHILSQNQCDFELEFFGRILLRNPDDIDVLRRQGELLSRKRLYHLAQQIDLRLAALCPRDCVVHYNLACSLARGGRTREAIDALTTALEQGYDDFEYLELDSDLDSLRGDRRYRQLLKRFEFEPDV